MGSGREAIPKSILKILLNDVSTIETPLDDHLPPATLRYAACRSGNFSLISTDVLEMSLCNFSRRGTKERRERDVGGYTYRCSRSCYPVTYHKNKFLVAFFSAPQNKSFRGAWGGCSIEL